MSAPPGLAPYLSFAKLSPTTLAAIARVVESDADFRARVADAVDEETVGRPGWLWLARPEGWEDELAQLDHQDRAAREAERQARAERSATKRLESAQRAVRRAEKRAAEREAELERVTTALAEEQRRRVAADGRLQELETAVAELRSARAEAVRALKDVEAQLVQRSTELNATKARVRELETAGEDRARGTGPGAGTVSAGVDMARVAAEVAAAAEGASELARGLAGLSGIIDRALPADAAPSGSREGRAAHAPGSSDPEVGGRLAAGDSGPAAVAGGPAPRGSDRGAGTGDPSIAESTAAQGIGGTPASRPPPGVRRPLPLPGGMFDDSPEAADHLLRAPGARLVVDGYNVSMAGWPDLSVAGQRDRLVGTLSELAARTTTPVDVVFDGADVEPVPVPVAVRRLVHVRFSPPGVEADDVVIDMVAQLPATQPVVVVSSDNRVRAGARRQGANVVHARQLLAVAGRSGA